MAALGLGGKPYKKIKVTHLWGTATHYAAPQKVDTERWKTDGK